MKQYIRLPNGQKKLTYLYFIGDEESTIQFVDQKYDDIKDFFGMEIIDYVDFLDENDTLLNSFNIYQKISSISYMVDTITEYESRIAQEAYDEKILERDEETDTIKEKIAAGNSTIMSEWVNGNPDKITAKMISNAYDLGDHMAIDTMNETGVILGYGLVNVINLFNPEILIIGGGMSAAGERLLQPARKIVAEHALRLSREHCTIVTAQLGDSAGMLGAALYARQRFENGTRF